MKAYDNLGLCYEAVGKFDESEKTYQTGSAAESQANPGSPWPPDNLGAMVDAAGALSDAEQYLRESLRIDPNFPQAHYHLGLVLEKQNKDAKPSVNSSGPARLTPHMPQPHYALGRIYRRRQENGEGRRRVRVVSKVEAGQTGTFPALNLDSFPGNGRPQNFQNHV